MKKIDITIYRRHASNCAYKSDRYHPRCGCPLWGQFNWPKSGTLFEGKKLNRGQNKWSLETRSWTEAPTAAKQLSNDLNTLLEGKPLQPKEKEIEVALQEWLDFRSKSGLTNTKAKLMGDKLLEWCNGNNVLLLSALTPEHAVKFRMSLPFRTGDSSSLSVHLSVIGGFFNWCVGMKYLDNNPMPNGKQNPQFAVRHEKKEVVPPTKPEVQKVLSMAQDRLRALATLMRWTGMALVDAVKYEMSGDDMKKFGLPRPDRRPTLFDGTLLRGNRTKTGERYRVRIPRSLAQRLGELGCPAFPGSESMWRERLKKLFRDAGVKMTPHGFRHFLISDLLAQGHSVADVSKMVGTSEKEIRKTYEHWIKEAEDRLDKVQRESWLAQGLDEYGEEVEQ